MSGTTQNDRALIEQLQKATSERDKARRLAGYLREQIAVERQAYRSLLADYRAEGGRHS